MLFLFSCERCLQILALLVMMWFHLRARIIFVELPLPRCFCQLVGLPGAGALSLGVDFSFFLHRFLRSIFVFLEGFVPLAPLLQLGPLLILRILVLGGGVLGCFSFWGRLRISGNLRCSILFPWGGWLPGF